MKMGLSLLIRIPLNHTIMQALTTFPQEATEVVFRCPILMKQNTLMAVTLLWMVHSFQKDGENLPHLTKEILTILFLQYLLHDYLVALLQNHSLQFRPGILLLHLQKAMATLSFVRQQP